MITCCNPGCTCNLAHASHVLRRVLKAHLNRLKKANQMVVNHHSTGLMLKHILSLAHPGIGHLRAHSLGMVTHQPLPIHSSPRVGHWACCQCTCTTSRKEISKVISVYSLLDRPIKGVSCHLDFSQLAQQLYSPRVTIHCSPNSTCATDISVLQCPNIFYAFVEHGQANKFPFP